MKRNWLSIIFILIIVGLAGMFVWPTGPNIKIGSYFKEIKIHEGLDLQGGTRLVYQLDISKIGEKSPSAAQQGVVDVIEKRINFLGVSEPVIQPARLGSAYVVIVELPGVSDINRAKDLIGKTAQLKFMEVGPDNSLSETGLTGANLKNSDVQFDQKTGEPQVGLEFDNEGAKLFEQLTQKNLQKPLAIQLDEQIISAPTVQSVITEGKAVITGNFTIKDAKDLSKLLNAGALPVPVNIVEQKNVTASLGTNSVQQSLLGGLLGVLLVALFMILYYRFFGFLAVSALIIYSLVVISLLKLIPVTMTLSGIAGFILSIGMAVDANILIFERTKEETRAGKSIDVAAEEGFRRAWPSIRDSNMSSLITCVILYYGTTGLVRGFAVTLALGILVSMFTAIIVTRTFLRLSLRRAIK
ncbi:MAG: protein translocase subunit SecD [Candidatus Nealsonbacteria bacterium CG07_land_8_20_14_0_80_40_10]|nr:MAG: protein translocase subunit SecD [Candidatus Nealsonbacteria bacterium CG07_land_8_20_14_0_80_40_10]